jgi:hypothetical protein
MKYLDDLKNASAAEFDEAEADWRETVRRIARLQRHGLGSHRLRDRGRGRGRSRGCPTPRALGHAHTQPRPRTSGDPPKKFSVRVIITGPVSFQHCGASTTGNKGRPGESSHRAASSDRAAIFPGSSQDRGRTTRDSRLNQNETPPRAAHDWVADTQEWGKVAKARIEAKRKTEKA